MKTKGMGIALLSAAALLGGAAAQAAELPWTYGEIGYAKGDGIDTGFSNGETDAFDLKASVGFADMFHAALGYTDGSLEGSLSGIGSADADFDGYRLIFGVHPQLTSNTQLVFDATYFDYDVDGTATDGGEGGSFSFDASLDGFGLGAGLRHSLTDKFEIMGEVWYSDGDLEDASYNNTSIELSGRYNWTSSLSTGLTVGIDGGYGTGLETGDSLRLDVRWAFLGGLSK